MPPQGHNYYVYIKPSNIGKYSEGKNFFSVLNSNSLLKFAQTSHMYSVYVIVTKN